MRKSILAIAAAGSVFAVTAAGATGLGVGSTTAPKIASSGDFSVVQVQCKDTYNVSFTLNAAKTSITAVTAEDGTSEPTANCLSAPAFLSLNGASKTPAGGATTDAITGDVTFTLDEALDVTVTPLTTTVITIGPKA